MWSLSTSEEPWRSGFKSTGPVTSQSATTRPALLRELERAPPVVFSSGKANGSDLGCVYGFPWVEDQLVADFVA
jgi:hypothetical protein